MIWNEWMHININDEQITYCDRYVHLVATKLLKFKGIHINIQQLRRINKQQWTRTGETLNPHVEIILKLSDIETKCRHLIYVWYPC